MKEQESRNNKQIADKAVENILLSKISASKKQYQSDIKKYKEQRMTYVTRHLRCLYVQGLVALILYVGIFVSFTTFGIYRIIKPNAVGVSWVYFVAPFIGSLLSAMLPLLSFAEWQKNMRRKIKCLFCKKPRAEEIRNMVRSYTSSNIRPTLKLPTKNDIISGLLK